MWNCRGCAFRDEGSYAWHEPHGATLGIQTNFRSRRAAFHLFVLARVSGGVHISLGDGPVPDESRYFILIVILFFAAADRLIATKEEVAMLRNRFEAELARQANKAAKIAAANRLMSSLPAKGSRSKRPDRAQHKARTLPGSKGVEQTAEFLDQTLTGSKARGGKKKKRSALANASNPHHLRNYVPSRLPSSGHTNSNQANANVQNYLGPMPLRFLSAEIPPRRRKKAPGVQPTSQLTNPTDEWICAFCEYALFYGDELEYRRAIRNRKKILRRRRRARERAAAAASGNSTAKATEKNGLANDDYDELFEPDEVPQPPQHKQTKWKGDLHKDRDREQAPYG